MDKFEIFGIVIANFKNQIEKEKYKGERWG